jgi:hypothetical protein
MITSLRRRTLSVGLGGALLLAAASGCAEEDDDGGDAGAPASTSPAPSSGSGDDAPSNDELAAGLLPAEAFGPDAQVVTVDLRQLSTSPATLPEGATVTPAECNESLGAVQLGPDDFGAVVAQTAETPTRLTVEVLAEDERIEAGSAAEFDDLLARCSHIELTAPDGSTGTIDFRELDVPDVGELSAGVAFTLAIGAPDGSGTTITCLLAIAVEGQRMLFLQQAAPDGEPLDEAAFADLFTQAYEAQQEA